MAALCWYLLGYAFTYGGSLDSALRNKFIGNYVFALYRIREGNHNSTSYGYAWFLQQFFYALVCNSIVASALGGRTSTVAHVMSTIYTVSFLFPVIAHFVWSTDGWLSAIKPAQESEIGTIGAIDMAGSGVVHLLGGSISLAASLFLRKRDAPKAASEDATSLTLGAFLKLFAMYSYVTGASVIINPETAMIMNQADPVSGPISNYTTTNVWGVHTDSNDRMYMTVGRGAVCLTLSVAASSLTVLFLESLVSNEVNLTHAVNALTIGFAAISSNIYTCEPWAALIAGFVAGLLYIGGRRGLKSLKDNDTFVIHGLGGIWGLLFTGFLAKPKFIRDAIGGYWWPQRFATPSPPPPFPPPPSPPPPPLLGRRLLAVTAAQVAPRHSGVFYPHGGPNGKLLGAMLLEIAIVICWGFVMALPLFGVLSAMKKLTEKAGDKYTEKTDA